MTKQTYANYHKEYYKRNSTKIYEKNKEYFQKKSLEYYRLNKDRILLAKREQRKANRIKALKDAMYSQSND